MRKSEFSCAKAVAQPVYENEKITVLPNTEVVKVEGRDFLEKLTYKITKTVKRLLLKIPMVLVSLSLQDMNQQPHLSKN